jgi:hypothetical protein
MIKQDWKELNKEIKAILTPEQYKMAQDSRENAHYTSKEAIQGIYQGLVHLGFKGGRILEPSMGIGHFIGLQSEGIVEKSKTTGVELDEISGLIGRLLYPQSDIRIEGFQNAKLADGYFDVVVGNVPFGNTGVNDSKFNKLGLSKPIHDYFFAKSLDKVREGGLMMLITSRYTLDKEDSRLQHYMKDKVDHISYPCQTPLNHKFFTLSCSSNSLLSACIGVILATSNPFSSSASEKLAKLKRFGS